MRQRFSSTVHVKQQSRRDSKGAEAPPQEQPDNRKQDRHSGGAGRHRSHSLGHLSEKRTTGGHEGSLQASPMMQLRQTAAKHLALLSFLSLSPVPAASLIVTFPQTISSTLMRTENATETDKGKRDKCAYIASGAGLLQLQRNATRLTAFARTAPHAPAPSPVTRREELRAEE